MTGPPTSVPVRRTALLALLALLAAGGARVTGAATYLPSRASLEKGFEAAMAAQQWSRASALADSLVRVRESREKLAPVAAAALLDSLGRRLFFGGSPEAWTAAEPVFRAGLARRERALGPDDPAVATNLATLATLYDYLGRWSEAVPLAERAVAIRTRAFGERRPETAASLRQLGLLRFQLGDYAGAAGPLERSQAVYDSLGAGFEAKSADGRNNLGELARVRDRLDEAERQFRLGLAFAEAHLPPTSPTRLALANNLAGLLKDVGRYDEAEPLLESGLATLESSGGDPEALAIARLNLGEVTRLQGRPEQAAPLYASALEEARRTYGERHPGLVPFLNQAAVCDQELERFAQAESLYRETGAILEATLGPDHPLLAQNLVDLARFRLTAYPPVPSPGGAPTATDSLLARALDLRERSLGRSHPDVALVLLEQSRAAALESTYPDALAGPLSRAFAILETTRAYPDARLDAFAQRARWHARGGRLGNAVRDMAVALATMDTLRARRGGGDETRAAFIARQQGLVDQMVGWQLESGDVEGALATHERGRARVLLDQIAASGVDLRAGIPPETLRPLADAERAAEARLASVHRALEETRFDPALSAREKLESLARLEARRDSAALELGRARRRIEDASPVWRNVLGAEGRVATLAQLQADAVPKGGIALVYHVGAGASRVFAVPSRGAARAFPLVLDAEAAATLGVTAGPLGEAALERIVGGAPSRSGRGGDPGIVGLLGGVAAGGFVSLPMRSAQGPDSLELRLHALWRTLVPEAMRRDVAKAKTVVVVPDGALQLVAFEALVTRPRGQSKTTRYWLDEGPPVAYGPSASSLRSLALRPAPASRAAGRPEVLSVSDVAYDAPLVRGRSWTPLPGTGLESRALVAAFGSANVEVLSGAAAREGAVRAALPGRRYVHLATHGFTDVSADRLLAGLVLAPPPAGATGSDDDGMLELFEIHRLALDCDLAMLSACETAKGPRVAGEGSFALSRAFLAAGSRRVVASLWKVDDQAAPVVVERLFDAIAEADHRSRPCDFAGALRAAKLAVRNDPRWSDPFYWAPFVLTGP